MSASAYISWLAGDCPCCGGEIVDWIDGTEPAAVAEGVRFCGRCIAMEHCLRPGEEPILQAILTAIVIRDDQPVYDASGA